MKKLILLLTILSASPLILCMDPSNMEVGHAGVKRKAIDNVNSEDVNKRQKKDKQELIEKYRNALLQIIKPGFESLICGSKLTDTKAIKIGDSWGSRFIISKNNKFLFLNTNDKKISVFDVNNYENIKLIKEKKINGRFTTHNNDALLIRDKYPVNGNPRSFRIWDIRDISKWKKIRDYIPNFSEEPGLQPSFIISPDGKFFVAAYKRFREDIIALYFYHFEESKQITQIINNSRGVEEFFFCNNNLLILQCPNLIIILDTKNRHEPKIIAKIETEKLQKALDNLPSHPDVFKDVHQYFGTTLKHKDDGPNTFMDYYSSLKILATNKYLFVVVYDNFHDSCIISAFYLDTLKFLNSCKFTHKRAQPFIKLKVSPCERFLIIVHTEETWLDEIPTCEHFILDISNFDWPTNAGDLQYVLHSRSNSDISPCGKYLVSLQEFENFEDSEDEIEESLLKIAPLSKWVIDDLSYDNIVQLVKLIQTDPEQLIAYYAEIRQVYSAQLNFYIRRYIRNKLIDHYVLAKSTTPNIANTVINYLEVTNDILKERQNVSKCAKCNETAPAHRCSRCQLIYYCSRDCQKAHWSIHKLGCLPNESDNMKD